jgi:peptidoglycan/LPS O-acetylase OafA/YrhL
MRLYIVGAALLLRQLGWFDKKLVVHLYITTSVPLLIHLSPSRAWLSGSAARWAAVAGNATCLSYLLHSPLQMALMLAAAIAGWRMPSDSPLFFLAYLAVSMALGVAAYRLFEMPVQNGLRRLLLRPQRVTYERVGDERAFPARGVASRQTR